jgi:hypothetical protein
MTTQTIDMPEGELIVRLPGGRLLHVWAHDCPSCSSVDVWTQTSDLREHAVSENTGDETRAPLGIMAITNGQRRCLEGGYEPTAQSHGYPTHSTAVLVWNDRTEVQA